MPRMIVLLLILLPIGSAPAQSTQPATDTSKADKDAPIPGAKLVGRSAIGIASNMELASTPSGPRLLGLDGIFAASHTWTVWDATGKKVARMTNNRGDRGFLTADACTPALSPDGSRLALVYRWQINMFTPPTDVVETVVYDLKANKSVFVDKRKGPVRGVLYTPKGTLLLFDADSCHVLEAGKTKFSRAFKLAAPMAAGAAVAPDDASLALYSQGTLHVYDLAAGKLDFELVLAAKPKKEDKQPVPPGVGKKFPGVVTFGGDSEIASMTYANSASEPKLLIYESVLVANVIKFDPAKFDPKAFAERPTAEVRLRLVDVKAKKQVEMYQLPKRVLCIRPYFTADGEARALTSSAVIAPPPEPAKKDPKAVTPPQPKGPPRGPIGLDMGFGLSAPEKNKFQVINMAGKVLNEFMLSNPPLLIPDAPSCLLSADGRYLAAITTTAQLQQKSSCMATLWKLPER